MNQRYKWLISTAILLLVVSLYLYFQYTERATGPVLQFCGGAREIGGSCLLVENDNVRFLVDCGSLGSSGTDIIPSKPADIAFVILTHAHLDHCGLLPELYASGFNGKVYCTNPTAEIVPIMLKMMRGISRRKVPRDDFECAVGGLIPVPFDSMCIVDNISITFRSAEHLLGAAFVEIIIAGDGAKTRLVVSGDLGSGNSLLLPPINHCRGADYLVMESTYGGKVRGNRDLSPMDRHRTFATALGKALRRGGDVLIPAFTLGRTQEVMAVIDLFKREGVIPQGTEVYVDSPTARTITDVYRRFRDELSAWARDFYGDEILSSPDLREVRSRTSLKVHERSHRPTIFISSSGNLGHANSPRHLMRMFHDKRNLLCIVGYQSLGSPGARLRAGESPVLIRHQSRGKFKEEWIAPVLEVLRFDSFSAHADQEGLLEWLENIQGVKRIFLVHGEPEQAQALAWKIRSDLGLHVEIPERGDRSVLSPSSDQSLQSGIPVLQMKGEGKPNLLAASS